MNKVIYWLTQIHAALNELGGKVGITHQSDWEEADETSPAYIANKPEIPVVPSIPEVVIVEGTVSTDAFTPDDGQPTIAEVADTVAGGGIAYLKYVDTESDLYEIEMVIACDEETVVTKNLTWASQ